MGTLAAVTAFLDSGGPAAWVLAASSVVGGFRVITTMTPNKTDDKVLNSILKVLNLFSGAVGKNRI